MSWPSLSQIADAGIDRRQVLRSSATALAVLGTATPSAGRSNTAPTPTEAVEDRLAPSTAELTQQQKLTPDDGNNGDNFGGRVAVSSDGTTALIGAYYDEDPNGEQAGSAYIFTRTDGTWTQQQKLVADDGDSDDGFGLSVALSNDGTTALIGAAGDEDPNGEQAGSAYIFTRTDGTWTQQQKVVADGGDSEDGFGLSVALSNDGTTALIGAMRDQGPTGEEVGSAYVFTHTDGEWGQQQKLMADDGDSDDRFGGWVALSGNGTTAVIGASNDDKHPNGEADGQFAGAGSAYVFTHTDDEWSQQQKLTADDSDSEDWFGYSAALSDDGTTALIGAHNDEDPNGPAAGSAYIFTRTDGTWTQQQKLVADDGDSEDSFGISVALSNDGTTALISAVGDEDPNGEQAGSAYIFTRTDSTWTQQQKLVADDGSGRDWFGWSVALSNDATTALVGAPLEDPNGDQSGSAYVFTNSSDDDDGDSALRRFDTNDNGQIDFSEVLAAVAANNNGTQIGGEPVDFRDVIAVIRAYNTGTQL